MTLQETQYGPRLSVALVYWNFRPANIRQNRYEALSIDSMIGSNQINGTVKNLKLTDGKVKALDVALCIEEESEKNNYEEGYRLIK